jgi:hypothetical protein
VFQAAQTLAHCFMVMNLVAIEMPLEHKQHFLMAVTSFHLVLRVRAGATGAMQFIQLLGPINLKSLDAGLARLKGYWTNGTLARAGLNNGKH